MPFCFTIYAEKVICTDKVSGMAFTTVITVAFVCAVFGNMTKLLALETMSYRFNVFYTMVLCS